MFISGLDANSYIPIQDMFSLRLCLILFWILYIVLKIIRWTIRKWTSQDRRENDGNVSKSFNRGRGNRFILADSACRDKNEVEAEDTIDVIHARINRLEDQMCDLAYNMTTFKAENMNSEKQMTDYLHTLGDKIDKIEKYVMATKITNESADHNCCGRSAETASCCAINYKMFKNLMEAFEKTTDESRKSMNGKIDQILIDIATIQMNNARNPLPQSIPVLQTINASPEVISAAQQSSTTLLTMSSHNIGITEPQTPAVSVTSAHPVSSNNNDTGIVDTRTVLQEAMSKMISEEYSSDGWSEDENGYSSDDWSEDEKGFIPPPPRRPIPPLPVASSNDVTGFSLQARPESSNNDEIGVEDTRTVIQETGSNVISRECSSDGGWSGDEIEFIPSPLQRLLPPISEILDDYDSGVQDIQTVVQEYRPKLNPEELYPNNSIVMAWYAITLNKFDSAAKCFLKLVGNFDMSSSEEREATELMEVTVNSDRNSEDNIPTIEDNEYQVLRQFRRSMSTLNQWRN